MSTRRQLYPFQEEGAHWLADHRRGYLADDCGLGKTIQACAAARMRRAKSVLVIAPASAIPGWYREWREWGYGPATFGAISYNRLLANPEDVKGGDWQTVILDEAHYLKTRNAQRTLAALRVARAAGSAWLLSATPMPNHLGELWPPMRALWPGVPRQFGIDNYRDWLNTFCNWTPTIYGPKVWSAKNTALLKPYLRKIMLRRMLDDVGLQMPPLRVDVQLLERSRELIDALEEAGFDAEALDTAMGEEESLSRLRRLLGTFKAPLIAAILAEELKQRQYRKLVVLAHHHDTLALLEQALDKFGVVGFSGGASQKKRAEAEEEFTHGAARVFLGQQSAAGIAINLQVAHEIVLVEPSWSPEDNWQAVKRVHRIGSTSPCRARIFAVEGTLDEGIMEVTARKTRMRVDAGL